MNALALMAVLSAGALRCPKCHEAITRTQDYQADWRDIRGIGGTLDRICLGEDVTLVCEACGERTRTSNWKAFLDPDVLAVAVKKAIQ